MEDLVLIEKDNLHIGDRDQYKSFHEICGLIGHLYTPGIPYKYQARGYKVLRQLVVDRVELDVLICNKGFFHPNLHSVLIGYWEIIRYSEVDPEFSAPGFFMSGSYF